MKIGFIDYFLDEWHANNYPAWMREASGGKLEIAYAYGMIDSPLGGLTTDKWCEKSGVTRCRSLEEIVEKSDGLLVLSPDNCEMHEALCQIPLRSGKPTYIDKTFAPDYTTAKRIFAIAEAAGTPCYSTSALRFAEEYADLDRSAITAISCWGPNDFDTYSIHQLEPLMMLMGVPAKRVLAVTAEGWLTLNMEFTDGRAGTITCFRAGSPFVTHVSSKTGSRLITVQSDFFQVFCRELCDFYFTGNEKVSHAETLSIMAVRTAGLAALRAPGTWIAVDNA